VVILPMIGVSAIRIVVLVAVPTPPMLDFTITVLGVINTGVDGGLAGSVMTPLRFTLKQGCAVSHTSASWYRSSVPKSDSSRCR